VVNASGCWVTPGLVDVQVNGGFGFDFTADPTTIWEVGRRLPRTGVTAFLPTLVSPNPETVHAAADVLRAGAPDAFVGAKPLGLHVEGPYLAPTKQGVHPAEALASATTHQSNTWPLDQIAMVTLAPELSGAIELIEDLVGNGIVVSLGHSNCTVKEAHTAFNAGAATVTHLFNAMSGLHHCQPGLCTAALRRPEVAIGLIVDAITLTVFTGHIGNTLFRNKVEPMCWETHKGPFQGIWVPPKCVKV